MELNVFICLKKIGLKAEMTGRSCTTDSPSHRSQAPPPSDQRGDQSLQASQTRPVLDQMIHHSGSPLGHKQQVAQRPDSGHKIPCRGRRASPQSGEPPPACWWRMWTWSLSSISAGACGPQQGLPRGAGPVLHGRRQQGSDLQGPGGPSLQDLHGWSSCTTEVGWSTDNQGRRTLRSPRPAAGGNFAGRRKHHHHLRTKERPLEKNRSLQLRKFRRQLLRKKVKNKYQEMKIKQILPE